MELTPKHYYAAGGVGAILLILLIRSLTATADEPLPGTVESETQWKCRACQHAYRMTARQAGAAMRSSGKLMPVYCPECDKLEAWRAAICRVHSNIYLVADAPGSRGVCEQCHPLPPVEVAAETNDAGKKAATQGQSKAGKSGAKRAQNSADATPPPPVRRVPVI